MNNTNNLDPQSAPPTGAQPRPRKPQVYPSRVSGHTLWVANIFINDLPKVIDADGFTRFWIVRNTDAEGVPFLYLGKGFDGAPDQIVAWYPNGRMWASFGTNIPDAIEGAQRNGWLYAS